MKKIKKKKSKISRATPAYVIGYTNTDAPAPGFLAAWFNQAYGGPLAIQFTSQVGHSQFEAVHTQWCTRVNTHLPQDTVDTWCERLQWGHSRSAEVVPLAQSLGQDKRDNVLHVARVARGLTLLTEGTAYDVVMGSFLNPSDWSDKRLEQFLIEDHVRVDQKEQLERDRVWFYTQGLAKFGLEEIEVYGPLGLSEKPVIKTLLLIAEAFVSEGKEPKIGESVKPPHLDRFVRVVRYRTDQSSGRQLNLREVAWE